MKKSVRKIFALTFMLLLFTGSLKAQDYENKDIVGKWHGTLDVMGQALEMYIELNVDSFNRLQGYLTIPIQMVRKKLFDEVIFDYGELEMTMKDFNAKFSADYINDSLKGKWKQSVFNQELNFGRTTEIPTLERPQEPKEPFPYLVREVKFLNEEAEITLSGTLTLPGEGKYPGVILVSGSGPQDRDETIFGHKPFKLLAHELTQLGFAVLRYDDRGVGDSEGNHGKGNTADFASDALSAFEYLKAHENVDGQKTGIIGHSEGAMIAFMLAAEHKDIDFVISLAGPGIPIRELMLEQTEAVLMAEGYKMDLVKKSVETNKRIYDIVIKNQNSKKLKKKLGKEYENIIEGLSEYEKEKLGFNQITLQQNLNVLASPFYRYFLAFNPEDYLSDIQCPVLAINGTKDVQVLYQSNLENIEKTLSKAENQNFETIAFEGLNHLLQPSETGAISEYPKIETTIAPEVINKIRDWLENNILSI